MSSALITVYLLVYGAAGIAGNFLGGSAVGRYPRATFAAAAALIAGATLLLPVLGRSDVGAVALLIVWGVAYGAVPVCSQTWFAKASPDSPRRPPSSSPPPSRPPSPSEPWSEGPSSTTPRPRRSWCWADWQPS